MDNKKYITIGAMSLIIIAIIVFLFTNSNDNWTTEILKSDSYTTIMEDCNNRKVTIPSDDAKEILKKIDQTSDNGPWTGNNSKCYSTITITYDKNGIVQQREIKLIDNNSIAVNLNNGDRYYVNAKEIIDSANNLFNEN